MGSISVVGLGKAYRRYPSQWSRVGTWLAPKRRNLIPATWVLKNISFRIEPGEAVGLIGANGAGKSTLLKIITGTMSPTEGNYAVEGSVAAMLELGMGFHPDFTGRENVYGAAQLLGLQDDEIERLFPEVVDFAEIGDYIDKPVRIYSSGMQMRLAFSVASAKRPDVLIVDEAFAVGDTYFQHKSFDRIRAFRDAGTTLVLVSHDASAIKSICDRAILLEDGHIVKDGFPSEVLDFYNALMADRQAQHVVQSINSAGAVATVSGTGEARVGAVRLMRGAEPLEVVSVGDAVFLEIEVNVHGFVPRLVLGYMIKDRLGQAVYGTNTDHKGHVLQSVQAGEVVRFRFGFHANIGPGTYSISTSVSSTETHLVNNYEWKDLAMVFSVVNASADYFVGSAYLDPTVEVMR